MSLPPPPSLSPNDQMWTEFHALSCYKRWGSLSQPATLSAASKQEEMNNQCSSQQGWAGVTFIEKATATLSCTSISTLAPSSQPCTCLCCLWSWGGLSSAFLAAKGGQCWGPPPLLCRVCPGWLLSLARLQELPERHSSSQNTALNEATALQNLPFFSNIQTHLLFPYMSKHVRYFERDLWRTC